METLLKNTEVEAEATSAQPEEKATAFDNSKMKEFVLTLDEGIRDNKAWDTIESPQELAKSFTELQKLVGKKGEIPKEDATPEDWSAFYNKLGRPETFSDYEVEPLEGLDRTKLDTALELAYEAGLTKTQANKLFNGLMESESKTLKEALSLKSDNQTKEVDKLKDSWGNAYEEMVESVIGFQKSLGIYESFEAKGLNGDADLLIFMADVASKFSEGEAITVASTNTTTGLDDSISEINAEIMEYVKKGEDAPAHLNRKKHELFAKRYN